MKWENIKVTSFIFIITHALFFLTGLNTFIDYSSNSAILAMIIAAIISFFILSWYLYLNKNRTLSIDNVSKPVKIICIPVLLLILNYSLEKVNGFVTYNVVEEIPFYILSITFLALIILVVRKGFKTIIRSSFIYMLIILLLTVIAFFTLFIKIDIDNILPIVDASFNNILHTTLLFIIVMICPYFCLPLFNIKISKERSKSLKKGFLLTQVFLFVNILLILSILGVSMSSIYPYPEVTIFKKISFLNVIDRMETIFSLSYFLSIFMFFSTSIYFIFSFLKEFIKIKKEEILLFVIALAILVLNNFYSTSITVWFICLTVLPLILRFACKSRSL